MEIIVSAERNSEFETRELSLLSPWSFQSPKQVRIEANKKEHLDAINGLTSIRVLVVQGPGSIDLGCIGNLRHLEALIVFDAEILNDKNLKDFQALRRFTHVGPPSIDINYLKACPALEHVNLPEYSKEDLADLLKEKPAITSGFTP